MIGALLIVVKAARVKEKKGHFSHMERGTFKKKKSGTCQRKSATYQIRTEARIKGEEDHLTQEKEALIGG